MNLEILRPGHRIRTRYGREAEVLEEVREGATVRVAYLGDAGGPFGVPARTSEEELIGDEDVETLLGVVPPSAWQRALYGVRHLWVHGRTLGARLSEEKRAWRSRT